MATIHKLTKDGSTIFPATITDAIVHPNTGKTLTSMIKDYNVSELFPSEGLDGGNKYNLALAIQVLGSHLTAAEKTGGIKVTFISAVSPYPEEEYYLNKNTWSTTLSDWGQRFEVGDVIANPSGSWEQGTAEQYIDQQTAILTTNLASETVARQTVDSNLQTQINTEVSTRSANDTTQNNRLGVLEEAYRNLTESDVIVGPRPSSGQQANVIYREPDQGHTPPQFYCDYMWYDNAWVLMAQYDNGIDNNPLPNSNNLVKSSGVFNSMGAYDISANNGGHIYQNLTEALNAVPSGMRAGGISVKFIQEITPAKYNLVKTEGLTTEPTGTELSSDPNLVSGTYTASQLNNLSTVSALPTTLNSSKTYYLEVSGDSTTYTKWVVTYVSTSDNKYVQYRLMSDSFNTIVANWQGVDSEPVAGSNNLVKSGGVKDAIISVVGGESSEIRNISSSNLTHGYFYSLSEIGAPQNPAEMSGFNCFRTEVKTNDVITISTLGGGNARAWALTNANRAILSRADANADTTQNPIVVTATVDGYLYINCKNAGLSFFSVTITRSVEIEGTIKQTIQEVAQSYIATNSVARMYNPTVDLRKSYLKVLIIGNSYTHDYTKYLNDIISAAGIENSELNADYSIYRFLRSSGSFKTWYDCYNDNDDADYYLNRVSGKAMSELSGTDGVSGDGSLFRNALNNVVWDLILVIPVSRYSNDYSIWLGDGDGGYLQEFIQILKKTNPQATIGAIMGHSYAPGYIYNTEGSTTLRWQHIISAAKEFYKDYGIDIVIPCGTAIENIRASSLNDQYYLSRDDTHLGYGLARYTAACCVFQSIIAPKFGISIFGNTWRKPTNDGDGGEIINQGFVAVDNNTAPIAQKAAFLATCDMYSITNPED